MKRIKENSRLATAICAISEFGLIAPWRWITAAICAPMAWIVTRFGEECVPLLIEHADGEITFN